MSRQRKKRHTGCLVFLVVVLIFAAAAGAIRYFYMTGSSPSFNHVIGHEIREEMEQTTSELPEIEQGWYYDQMDADSQQAYRTMYSAVAAGEEEFEISGADIDWLQRVWKGMMADHPEFFWLTGGTKMTKYEPVLGDAYTVIEPQRNCSGQEQEKRAAQIEEAVSVYMQGVREDEDDYTKIQSAYEYIINETEYDVNASDSQNIYSVFGGHRSVCAGYAKAFQYLMKKQGISCVYVTGTITESGEAHGWNIVRCDGQYYQVDVTWGDPVYNETADPVPASIRTMNYDYLCCSDAVILQTHEIDDTFPVPECLYEDLNYYRVHGWYYVSYEREEFRQIIYDDVDNQRPYTVFCFSDSALYEQAREDLTDVLLHDGANRILQNTGLSTVKTYYEDEPAMNKIVVYWQYE